MTIHPGVRYRDGDVSIGAPPPDTEAHLPLGANEWVRAAPSHADMYYFVVYDDERPVGYILLHDIDQQTGESLIGYALAVPSDRGRGLGTKALGLLQLFVRDATRLTTLIIITSRDNEASQRIAVKCGFLHTGPSREDPLNGMVFEWVVRR